MVKFVRNKELKISLIIQYHLYVNYEKILLDLYLRVMLLIHYLFFFSFCLEVFAKQIQVEHVSKEQSTKARVGHSRWPLLYTLRILCCLVRGSQARSMYTCQIVKASISKTHDESCKPFHLLPSSDSKLFKSVIY